MRMASLKRLENRKFIYMNDWPDRKHYLKGLKKVFESIREVTDEKADPAIDEILSDISDDITELYAYLSSLNYHNDGKVHPYHSIFCSL